MRIIAIKFSAMILATGFALECQSQETNQTEVSRYSFLVGEWEGSGTAMNRQNESETFTVKESLKFDLDSTIIMLTGIGISPEGEKVNHAIGILYYDNYAKKCKKNSYIMQGRNTTAEIMLTGVQSFKWWFETPNGGKMEYSAVFSENTWVEEGSYISPDGGRYPVIKMELARVR